MGETRVKKIGRFMITWPAAFDAAEIDRLTRQESL